MLWPCELDTCSDFIVHHEKDYTFLDNQTTTRIRHHTIMPRYLVCQWCRRRSEGEGSGGFHFRRYVSALLSGDEKARRVV